MIGDWVQTPQGPRTVKQNFGVDGIYTRLVPEYDYPEGFGENEIAPISLTPEILEKNFPTTDEIVWWQRNPAIMDGYFHIEYAQNWIDCFSINIRYVHELQHALRLCGIEKDIVI